MEVKVNLGKQAAWPAAAFVLAVLLVVAIFTSGFGYAKEECEGAAVAAAPAVVPAAAARPAAPTGPVDVSADDDAFKGDENAPVTIIEFSDYQCPFCLRHFTQTLPQLEEEYINTGKVKYVFRDYPLGFHEHAQKAAEAAECAGEQGKYWEMHDIMFENQQDLGTEKFYEWAKEIGLNEGDFKDCLDSGKMAEEVKKDFADGQSYGVTGTPGFFVNGNLIKGAQPFSAFKALIEAELAK